MNEFLCNVEMLNNSFVVFLEIKLGYPMLQPISEIAKKKNYLQHRTQFEACNFCEQFSREICTPGLGQVCWYSIS